jgi:prepilin peptidase CpaA
MATDAPSLETQPTPTEAPTQPQPTPPPASAPPADDLGIDREFALQMARMPLLALVWVAGAFIAHQLWAAVSPGGLNAGPLAVVCFGMILAAFIDGWALKVPNWVTLPLILSGWMLGILHDCGVGLDAGTGGFVNAFVGSMLGFLFLYPMLVIRGVGEGDVKMQMGFGAWVGAFFGSGDTTLAAGLDFKLHGYGVVFWGFVFGALIGGAFSLIMILMRRKWKDNAFMVSQILTDLRMFGTGQASQATQRAEERRKSWVKLPYGIPLCVGFLMYLGYVLILRT